MLVVTSQADDATGVAFPLGRAFSNVFSRTPLPRRAQDHLPHRRPPRPLPDPRAAAEGRRHRARSGRRSARRASAAAPIWGRSKSSRWQSEDAAFFADLGRVQAEKASGDGKVYEMGARGELRLGAGLSARPPTGWIRTAGRWSSTARPNTPPTTPISSSPPPPTSSPTTARSTASASPISSAASTSATWCNGSTSPTSASSSNPGRQCIDTDVTPCERSWTGRLAYGCGPALPVPPPSAGN